MVRDQRWWLRRAWWGGFAGGGGGRGVVRSPGKWAKEVRARGREFEELRRSRWWESVRLGYGGLLDDAEGWSRKSLSADG